MSTFYLPSTTPSTTSATPAYSYPSSNLSASDENDDGSDDDNLPYPQPLPRTDFLSPNFNPQTYLSTLRNRHQTLEDLRSDLRQRSQLLNKELLDLVNGNYEEFLSLGGDLKGGEERVEGVRVGVLGFRREVEGVRGGVVEREREVRGLLEERRRVRRGVMLGRGLLVVEGAIAELEGRMGITEGEELDEEGEVEDEEDEEEDVNGDAVMSPAFPVKRLRGHAQQYLLIMRHVERLGPSHPFLRAQQGRLAELRKTLLLDLAAALRAAKTAKANDAVLAIVRVYGELDAQGESVRVLRVG